MTVNLVSMFWPMIFVPPQGELQVPKHCLMINAPTEQGSRQEDVSLLRLLNAVLANWSRLAL